MRQLPLVILGFIVTLVVVVPTLLVRGCSPGWPADRRVRPSASGDIRLKLYLPAERKLVDADLEEYTKGVIAAEMPSSFEAESLKAQAVLARTYALNRMRVFGGPGCDLHPEADVCADPEHSQAYVSREELRARIGWLASAAYWRRIERAVEDTRGLMLTYEGAPIQAVYHSTSAGSTEDAQEVWGKSYSYLKPVPSDDRSSPRYQDKVGFKLKDLAQKLGEPALATLAGSGRPFVQVIDRTAGGRVRTLRVGDKTFKATDLRRLLNLRSTNFTWRLAGDQVEIETLGWGHGVGLSQYGANDLARQGKDYREILAYYYQGVSLDRIFGE